MEIMHDPAGHDSLAEIASETLLWEQMQLPYQATRPQTAAKARNPFWRTLGMALIALALGGIARPLLPTVQAEANYRYLEFRRTVTKPDPKLAVPMPKSVPKAYNPLIEADGTVIVPVNTDFGIVVPKVGINAPVIPSVNPADTKGYEDALLKGVAHSSTSFFPDENGAVYLFSHSTSYEWFVKDLNAVFYLLKNLDVNDPVVLIYKGKRYTYRLSEKRIVSPDDVSFLNPIEGKKMLILQTCWPPGSTTQRLLLFADLTDVETLE